MPYIEIGPFGSANKSAKLATALESQIANEAASPSGWILPVPDEGLEDDDLTALDTKLRQLRGRTALVSSSRHDFGDGGRVHSYEYQPRRIGVSL